MKKLFLAVAAVCLLSQSSFAAFTNESTLGVVSAGGNTQTSSISAKQKNEVKWEKNSARAFADFLTASSKGNQSAYSWSLGARYERELSEDFAVYLGQKVDSDKYQNILQRYSSDVGGKYSFNKTEKLIWFSELGYRFSRENYPYGFKNFNFARIYNEVEGLLSKSMSAKWWIEFLPNLTDSNAYQLNTEASVSATLSEIFSLKLAYLIKYNNTPPTGTVFKTDSVFTTALVAKF